VVRYCDRSLCDDHVEALRNRVLAYRMNEWQDARCVLAYRMNDVQDVQLDVLLHDVLGALYAQLDVLLHDVLGALYAQQDVLLHDALGARCDQLQILQHGSLAFHPFQRLALMQIDVGCPLGRLRSLLTSKLSSSENALREVLSDQ
jgi:hypothetical protein